MGPDHRLFHDEAFGEVRTILRAHDGWGGPPVKQKYDELERLRLQ